MRRVALIYNPVSGQHSKRRAAILPDALAALHGAGIETEVLETNGPGSAGACAQEAIRRGCDTILALGGDGTVHEVMQCLVGTDVALGVVPMGTANALAHNLGLGSRAASAIRALLTAEPMAVRVGRIFYRDSAGAECSRYFTVAAGIGLDAMLMSRQNSALKRRFGYALYVLDGFMVWATRPFPLFRAEFQSDGGGAPRVEEVSEVMTVRIRTFGGLLGTFLPGASLHNDRLRMAVFKTRSRMRYFRFLMALLAGRHTFSNQIELVEATTVECRARDGSEPAVYVEADGEVLGTLPARIEIAPQPLTLTLLVPPNTKP
jgi:YegS/Rv2252/BmrU family lipid kinase